MIFIWSAGNNPAEFNPLQANGNVTGAGFAQLADISDSLTGMIVSNNTGFILRQQGISYATATSNGTSPFDFANVGLGPSGEGAQIPSLVCQYDQMGCYVGNSNIYGASQSISPIGNKIKSAIFAFLDTIPDPIPSGFSANNLYLMQSNAAALTLGGNTHPYFVFLIGSFLYIYSGINGTWMKLKYIFPIYPEVNSGAFLANFSNTSISTRQEGFKQDKMVAIQSIFNNSGGFTTYRAFSIAEGANLVALQNASLNPTVYFPVEQVAFGRDVTIDSLLIAYDYNTGGDGNSSVTLNFYFNDANQLSTLFATHQVPIGIGLLPIAHNIAQIFPTVAPGIFTAKDPQLFITVGIGGALTSAIIRITKITIFGTYDASQRPV
jgi:hypothetical protein